MCIYIYIYMYFFIMFGGGDSFVPPTVSLLLLLFILRRSPVLGFGRNSVEIHRSAPPQLSERLLGGNFGQKSWKTGRGKIPRVGENNAKKIYKRQPFYIFSASWYGARHGPRLSPWSGGDRSVCCSRLWCWLWLWLWLRGAASDSRFRS